VWKFLCVGFHVPICWRIREHVKSQRSRKGVRFAPTAVVP
jgi:hypothetical protein